MYPLDRKNLQMLSGQQGCILSISFGMSPLKTQTQDTATLCELQFYFDKQSSEIYKKKVYHTSSLIMSRVCHRQVD